MPTKDLHPLPHYELFQIMQLGSVTFAEPGRLKCRAYYDDNEVRIGTLRVGFIEPPAESKASTNAVS